MKKTLKIAAIILLVLAVFFGLMYVLSKREKEEDYSFEPDSPEPLPHNGVFTCDYGTMTFNGDGKTVILDAGAYFSRITGIPEGKNEGVYEFLDWAIPPQETKPIRYDMAHKLRIMIDEESYVLEIGIASEDHQSSTGVNGTVTDKRIPIVYIDDYKFYSMIFRKK